MARLFILFLIALLPLRGWTAERMVFQMGQGAPLTAQAMDSAMPSDCALHMQAASGDPASHHATESGKAGHKGCQSCQLCMPLLALAAPVAFNAPFGPQAPPATGGSRFVSADTVRHAKPPIS